METVVFLDLDDTIFQTIRKCPEESQLTPAAYAVDGEPLSFMTNQQKQLLEWLQSSAIVIPTTARSLSAYQRVDITFSHRAILDFGGVILKKDGTLDQQWDDHIRPQLKRTEVVLHEILERIVTYSESKNLNIRARLISDFDLPLYVVVKHPDVNLDALQMVKKECLASLDTSAFFIHDNHNNLSVVPICLGKEFAVKYVLEQDFCNQQILTLGVGDSWTDLPYLTQCDFFLTPSKSQLAKKLLA